MSNLENYNIEMLLYIFGTLLMVMLLGMAIKLSKPKNHAQNIEEYNLIKRMYLGGQMDKNEFYRQRKQFNK